MDLTPLSLTELRRLQTRIESEIKRRADSTRKELLKKMEKMAAEQGLSLAEVVGEAPAPKAVAPARATATRAARPAKAEKKERLPAVYFDPANPAVGWSGKGRKPNWVIKWLAEGRPLEELARPA